MRIAGLSDDSTASTFAIIYLTLVRLMKVRETHFRPHKDHRGVDLISDALPFGRLWYEQAPDAIEYAKFYSRSHDAVIRVYDAAGAVIATHEHKGDFKEW